MHRYIVVLHFLRLARGHSLETRLKAGFAKSRSGRIWASQRLGLVFQSFYLAVSAPTLVHKLTNSQRVG